MAETRKTLRGIDRFSAVYEERYENLRLDKNENTAGFTQSVIEDMMRGITPAFLAAYPEPARLYRKIAASHGVDVDNVLITAGSEMAIRYLFEAYLEEGDEIVVLNPSFAMFEVYAKICGATIVWVDFDRGFHVESKAVLERIGPRTKIIAIANPNNPTGTVMSQEDLLCIVREGAAHGALVLVDEAYFYFYPETVAPHCRAHENLVVTRTFSKACGLAGVRLGYALSSPDVIKEMSKLQPIDHASNFALKLGEYLVDHNELVLAYVREVEKGKALLLTELAVLGLKAHGGAANFVLIDLGARHDEIVERLTAQGILVSHSLRFPFETGYVRVTVGPEGQMRVFVTGLRAAIYGSSNAVPGSGRSRT